MLLMPSAVITTAQASDKYEKLANMCSACHGQDGSNAFNTIPDLKWQNREYLISQLHAFKSGKRQDITMTKVAQLLSEEDMLRLADHFYAGKKDSSE
ncbi:cytochrome C [Endozoicomonas numazuensis]|uniref:Cytochrome C n=1 Tax=Endozoicomonas numazuensis TaxID=1137799 RepID=A0A081NHV7_9GAMM|nr:cytochrome C [Endozoicomonas numazuensis]